VRDARRPRVRLYEVDMLRGVGLNVVMPRKRPVKYDPIEVHQSGDLIIEVYADDQLPNGRGFPGKYKKIQTFNLALELLLQAKLDASKGLRRQLFAAMRNSASALERELTKAHGHRHSIQIQQHICRVALRTWGLTGDDQVRLPYVFDSQTKLK
jgi:hypothetical protein